MLCCTRIRDMLRDPGTGNGDALKAIALFMDHMNGQDENKNTGGDLVIAWREEEA